MPTIDEIRQQGLSNMPSYDYGAILSKKDQAMLQLDMNKSEWLNNLLLLDFMNEYNDPVSQVQRARAAGLNTDLLGPSVGGSSASMSAPSGIAPEGISGLDVAKNVFGIVSNVLNLTHSMVSGVIGIGQDLLKLDMNDLELGAKRLDYALGIAGMSNHYISQTPDGNFVMVDIPKQPLSHFQSKRNNREVQEFYERYFYNNKARLQYYKDANEVARLRMDLGERMSHPNYSNYDDEILEAFEPLSDYAYSALKSETEYRANYYERANELGLADLSAGSDYASRALAKDNDELTQSLKTPIMKVAKKLKSLADDGKTWAFAALIALYTSLNASANFSTKIGNSSFNFGK